MDIDARSDRGDLDNTGERERSGTEDSVDSGGV